MYIGKVFKEPYFNRRHRNNMKESRFNQLIILPILILLFAGCGSARVNVVGNTSDGKAVTEGKNENQEQISSIKVSEFILGAGDTIAISVYRNDDLTKTAKIDSSGRIMFPLIGDVQAAGKDIFAVRNEMQERLSKYLVDPQVTISVTAVQSQKIMVLGEVNNPGVFALDSNISTMEAITKAGGMTNDAKMSNVLLIRRKEGRPEVLSLDLKKALKKGDVTENRELQSGDIVYLPAVVIADVSWYFSHLSKILSPIVNLESGIVLWPQAVDVLRGTDGAKIQLSIPTN